MIAAMHSIFSEVPIKCPQSASCSARCLFIHYLESMVIWPKFCWLFLLPPNALQNFLLALRISGSPQMGPHMHAQTNSTSEHLCRVPLCRPCTCCCRWPDTSTAFSGLWCNHCPPLPFLLGTIVSAGHHCQFHWLSLSMVWSLEGFNGTCCSME